MSLEFHARLRYEREKRGWSRNYVAEQIEVDIATVGRWERGERLPYPQYRQKLCELFDLSAQEFGLHTEPFEQTNDDASPVSEGRAALAKIQKREEQQETSLFHQRRTLILTLGGLGITALLLEGGWLTASHISMSRTSSSHVASPTPAMGKLLFRLTDYSTSNWINNLAWSPDGSMLAAAHDIPFATIWNVAENATIDRYQIMGQWVNDVAWSRTNWLATASADLVHEAGAVQIWALSATTHPFLTLQRAYPLRTVSWSPDGAYLALAGHHAKVEIWGPQSKPVSRYLDTDADVHGINRVKWSSDSAYLAAAADDGKIYVWETATGKRKTVYQGHRERVVDIAWASGQYLIASASVDYTAQVWDALSGRRITTYGGHTGEVHGIDWSPDGAYVVSAGYDSTAQVWHGHTGKHIITYSSSSNLLTVLWSPPGRTIALGSQKQGIEIWQAPSSAAMEMLMK